MRRISIVSGLFLLCTFSVHSSASAKAAPDIVISEVQIEGKDGVGKSLVNDEFIELRNIADHTIDISGWKLQKRTAGGNASSIKSFDDKCLSLPPDTYLLWANGTGAFAPIADHTTTQSLAKTNTIELLDGNGSIHDSLAWGNEALAGKSLERDTDTLSWTVSNSPSPRGGGASCSIPEEKSSTPTPDPVPSSDDIDIRINELFPNPKEQGDASEFIELHNIGGTAADISGFVLRDASKTGKYILPAGTVIAARGYLVVSRAESGLSLNNTDETISLSDPSGNPVDSASYGTTKEEASYSHDGSSFRWSRYLTPGAPNRFGDAPSDKKTVIPEKAYKNVPATFSASGSDGRKYFWDFGDGDTSRKQEAIHTYEESGTYSGTLTISEGIEEAVKAFTVDVGKFPERKVSIAALSANPTGDDASSEWISLKNKDKKKIDLLGWSIATGSGKKKLSDHPIRESFVLKPGEERTLTREIAAFSLPNGKGHVELRQPDGKVLAKTSYDKERGVKENEVWREKDGGVWGWILEGFPDTPGRKSVTEPIGSEAKESGTIVPISPAPEAPRTVTLEDLSPEDRARLEAQAEEKVRRRIFAELLDDGTMPGVEEGTVLGASDERGSGYSGTIFRTINQALSELLSE